MEFWRQPVAVMCQYLMDEKSMELADYSRVNEDGASHRS
jgi:hypothetical protein